MTVPFLRAYTELLVAACHRRGAHAMGGMAAFIPRAGTPEVNERGAGEGARGQGAGVRRRLRRHLGGPPRPGAGGARSLRRACWGTRRTSSAGAATTSRSRPTDLLDFRARAGRSPRTGCATTSASACSTWTSWLDGDGAAAIYNLMEDAATAEIARSQIWQWVAAAARRSPTDAPSPASWSAPWRTRSSRRSARPWARRPGRWRWDDARRIFEEVALADDFVEFLTLPAYEVLD